MFVFVLDHCF